ncbi:MAG: nucleotidyltransferase family protein [bacterium]|nr:nucleotidyltransferase family protein [bacterium]
MNKDNIAITILSAGESKRMNYSPKANLTVSGKTFLETVISLYSDSGLNNITVITGKHHKEISGRHKHPNIKIIENKDYHKGQLSSIQTAIKTFDDKTEAILIHPVDQPLVNKNTISELISEYNQRDSLIYIPVYKGKRGHPVIFKKKLFSELLSASLNIGAREVVWNNPDNIYEFQVDDEGTVTNINTPEDYDKLS